MAGQWFSPVIPVSSTNKTDHHDITEILLKVALNNINLTQLLSHFDKNFMSDSTKCQSALYLITDDLQQVTYLSY